jgi:hypothetical protein
MSFQDEEGKDWKRDLSGLRQLHNGDNILLEVYVMYLNLIYLWCFKTDRRRRRSCQGVKNIIIHLQIKLYGKISSPFTTPQSHTKVQLVLFTAILKSWGENKKFLLIESSSELFHVSDGWHSWNVLRKGIFGSVSVCCEQTSSFLCQTSPSF